MPAPTYGPFTERTYRALPELYRDADAAQAGPDYPLKRYLGGALAAADELEVVHHRFVAGELFDAALADAAWLPWVAQFVGLFTTTDELAMRDAIAAGSTNYLAGTKAAIANAVRPVLTGTKTVNVYGHSIANPDDGGAWYDMLIITRADETPDPGAVTQAVEDRRAKPAGVVLRYRTYTADWATTTTTYPTWASRDDATWTDLGLAGLA